MSLLSQLAESLSCLSGVESVIICTWDFTFTELLMVPNNCQHLALGSIFRDLMVLETETNPCNKTEGLCPLLAQDRGRAVTERQPSMATWASRDWSALRGEASS